MCLHVSGGMFGAQSATEFCFTISSASLRVSAAKYVVCVIVKCVVYVHVVCSVCNYVVCLCMLCICLYVLCVWQSI